ncbi:unnamed protein product [Schistocephalus solidus]|uniref:MATH domain-containing protein n=1 Tax=Schistocephalus solidus TaxID=70667 RepID=A0A183SWV3_SCHSO|nr:unnamed protein product [Schistocephalus solidus]
MKSSIANINKANSLPLHRFVRLGGRNDAQVFTFIVSSQITRGFVKTSQSKDFCYGGQQWQLHISYSPELGGLQTATEASEGSEAPHTSTPPLQSRPLSVGLALCGSLAGMRCELETIRFTILNRESFRLNKSYEEKCFLFTCDRPLLWKCEWVQVDSLAPNHFLFDDWTWLLEVELQGASTLYEEVLTIPKTPREQSRCLVLESASFTYACSDWSVSLEWLTSDFKKHSVSTLVRTKPEGGACPRLRLHRHSSTNHWFRVRYFAVLEWGSLGESSLGPVDELITSENGASTAGKEIGESKWFSAVQQNNLAKHRVKISIQMLAAAPVSRIDLIPIAPQGGRNVARCKDPDGCDWVVVSDILGTLVRLRFFPTMRIHHHDNSDMAGSKFDNRQPELRCVSWNVHLIPFDTNRSVVKALSSPYTSYVPLFRCLINGVDGQTADISTQEKQMTVHPGEFTEVALDLPVEKICDANAGYIRSADNAMTIRIEWLPSVTLCSGNYGIYDDLFQTQKKQLTLELRTLQMENYALERQLYMSNQPVTNNTSSDTRYAEGTSSASPQVASVSSPETQRLSVQSRHQVFASPQRNRQLHSQKDNLHRSSVHLLSPIQASVAGNPVNRRSNSYLELTEEQGRVRRSLPMPLPAVTTTGNWPQQQQCEFDCSGPAAADTDSDESPPTLYVNNTSIRSNTSSPILQDACWPSGRPHQILPTSSQRSANSRGSRIWIID